MAPDLILVVAGLSAAWAFFSIVGGERQRVLQNAELAKRAATTPADSHAVISPAVASPTTKANLPSDHRCPLHGL